MDARMLRRFTAKVSLDLDSGCWLWTASKSGGYGQFMPGPRGTRPTRAYVVAYEHFVGPIPLGLELDHLCRTRACCNPAHLEPVTHRENVLRGESPHAANARKTHCVNGHPFDERNTYRRKDKENGRRQCRACCQARRRRASS
jgi:hypothetical protein